MQQNEAAHDGPTVIMAPISRRFLAKVLDGIIVALPASLVFAAQHSSSATDKLEVPTSFIALVLALAGLHDLIGIALWGKTLGKHVLGIRVRLASDGSLPGWLPALLRWIVATGPQLLSLAVGGVTGLYGIVDLSLGFRAPLHQCLHDLAARTVVVDERAMTQHWAIPPPSAGRWAEQPSRASTDPPQPRGA